VQGTERLSERELQVLALAARGRIDQAIAAELGITVATVRSYWARIRSKLGDVSRSELVVRLTSERAATDRIAASWAAHTSQEELIQAEATAIDRELGGISAALKKRVAEIREEFAARRALAREEPEEAR
jgi:DNA-binding CsgD family transcriptional regulator